MMLARHGRLIWISALALSPLAYLGSMLIERSLPARTTISALDEAQALRIGAQFAESRGIRVDGWQTSAGVTNNDDLEAVFRYARHPALEQITAPVKIRLLFQTGAGDRSLRLELSPQGRVIGFQEGRSQESPSAVEQPAARAVAEAFLSEWLGPNRPFELEYRPPSDADKDHQERTFTWRAPVPGLSKTTATFRVDTDGDRVMSERTSVTLDKNYLASIRPNHSWLSTLRGLGWFYICLMGVYAIVRYIRRAGDKEVSHHRTGLAALAWVSLSALILYDPGSLTALLGGEPELGRDRMILLILMMVSMCFLGAFFGVAYGAGEGGLRESYAGKLTSLDALFSGKLFSSNVSRSILVGGGIAGWLLLFQNGLLLVAGASRAGPDQEILASGFQRLPLIALILDRATDAVVAITFGLLLPIVLLRPRTRKPWLLYGLLGLCAVFSSAILNGHPASWATFLAVQLALVAAVFLPFISCDLLAGICAVFAVRFVGALIQRSAVSDTWQHIFTWDVAPAGIVFLLAEVYFAWRGRIYEEGEVRPRYARYLAEHISMEAEIGAARLAQLRLLPGAPPSIDGLSIAGSCVPAREVGGDFYDFYPLDGHRLGVFLAEGGSRELGSAMTIALAKGYLLYTTGLDLSPAEILRRLSEALGAALHSDASMSVLYAVVDTRARTIRFARTGVSPRLLINGNSAAEELSSDQTNAKGVRHGVAALAPRDTLFFFTDGLATQIAERKRQWTDKFVQKLLKSHPGWSSAELHAAIVKAAVRGKSQPPDDVTSVVVRLEEPAAQTVAQAREVVA